MQSQYETILYEVKDCVATITLNRPEVRNAINHQMELDVKAALAAANQDDQARLVVITGAGTAFCSGIDLKAHRGRTPIETRKHFESFYWGFHHAHRALEKPSLAIMNGPAREAGCTMAFMCDMIVAAESASIGFPAIDRGILPAFHLVHLPRVVGRLKAFELCFSGVPIPIAEAQRLGIVNQVYPDAQLFAEAAKFARHFINKSPAIAKMGRELFYRAMDMEFEKAIKTAGDVVALVAGLTDAVEGITAYVEKRPPAWRGD